jgi:hypothetical protein
MRPFLHLTQSLRSHVLFRVLIWFSILSQKEADNLCGGNIDALAAVCGNSVFQYQMMVYMWVLGEESEGKFRRLDQSCAVAAQQVIPAYVPLSRVVMRKIY